MEWLRSCYASSWRFFKGNPEILTPGFYYFNDKAPFWEGPQIFGSRNWTTDDFADPPIGEASGKQTYRNGSLPVAIPPATLVGDSTCVGSGDRLPLGVISRNIVGGIDSRCYSQVSQPVPDSPPATVLLPVGVGGVTPTFPGFTWPDTGFTGNPPSNYDPTTAPVGVIAPGGKPGLKFVPTSLLPFPRPITINGPFVVTVVVVLPADGIGTGGGLFGVVPGDPNGGLIQVKATSVCVVGSIAPVCFTTGNNFDRVHVWAVRYDGSNIYVYRDGVLVGSAVIGTLPALTVTAPAALTPGLVPPASLDLVDWRIYVSPLSPGGFASLLTGLTGLYPSLATVTISCGLCTVGPANWQLAVAGYTGPAAALNGTWVISYTSGCNWVSPTVGGASWRVSFTGGLWVVGGQTAGGVVSSFTRASASWACVGANTATYSSGGGDFGHPGSVVVSPV